MTRIARRRLRVLRDEEAEFFIEDGFVVVKEAFARATAEALLPHVWARVPEAPEDRSTWKRAATQIEEVIHDGPVSEIFTSRYRAAVDDLVGEGRWNEPSGFGWVVLRFAGFWKAPWRAPDTGWHVDGIHFHHRLRSPEQGLVGIELLTDIEPGGGGTAVRVGSHAVIARALAAAEPEGISYKALREMAEALQDLPAVEVTGRAGDVLWMHPFMAHARSPNVREVTRIASNRCIALREPFDLDAAGPRSLVEEAIVRAITRAR